MAAEDFQDRTYRREAETSVSGGWIAALVLAVLVLGALVWLRPVDTANRVQAPSDSSTVQRTTPSLPTQPVPAPQTAPTAPAKQP